MPRSRSWLALTAGLVLLAGLTQPAGEASAADGAAPAVVAKKKSGRPRAVRVRKIKPRAGAKFVALDTAIRVRFSRPIDPASVDSSTVVLRRLLGDPITWTAEFDKDGRVLVITPTSFLDPGRDYELVLRTGVRGVDGAGLRRETHAIFFTDPRIPPFQFIRPEQFVALESRMVEGRAYHSSTRMRSGGVLLAGGLVDTVRVADTADVFDPSERRFRPVSTRMSTPRAFHAAVPFGNSVMLVGGWNGSDALAATELYDSSGARFVVGPSMVERRDFTDAVTLDDGRVLVVGGLHYLPTGAAEYSTTAEIYDPHVGGFRLTLSAPRERRVGHRLTLLPDGRVLVSGGQAPGTTTGASAEIFDPDTETFRETLQRPLGFRQLHTATLLGSGFVLIADGGNGKMEVFDPGAERFFDAGGASFVRRTDSTASLLPGDKVLLLGGLAQQASQTIILETMDLYLPNLGGGTGRVVQPDVVLPEPRAGHRATELDSGSVLISGGLGYADQFSLSSALLFVP